MPRYPSVRLRPWIVAATIIVGANAPSNVFAAGWTSTDIGDVGVAGTADRSAGVWTVLGAGGDIWGDADAFQFVHAPALGNGGNIAVRVDDLQDTNPFAKAGIMLRGSLDANAATVLIDVKPNSEVEFMKRSSAGASMTYVTGTFVTLPVWLQLSWVGGTVTASVSQDGQAWAALGQVDVVMPATTTEAGAIVTSHDTSQLNTAHFERLSLLPADWTSTDIGATGLPGSALIDLSGCGCNPIWRVEGAGGDVWGSSDSFQFVHRTFSGDFNVDWNVLSLDATHPFAKAGLMVRDGLASNAVNMILDVKPSGEVEFMARECESCETQYLAGATVTLPADLYIRRRGSTFDALVGEYGHGTSGVPPQLVGSVTLPVGDSVEVGFAVTSHDTTKLAGAAFDHPAR